MVTDIMQEVETVNWRCTDRQPTFADFEFHRAVSFSAVEQRACGECSLCCKLLNIEAEKAPSIAKPAGTWCKHCRPGRGCGIYAERPELCASFLCGWRQLPLGEHWHPRKSGMVINTTADAVSINVDKGARDRWQADPWYADLLRLAALFINHGKFVVVYPCQASGRFVIDHMGGALPPLKLPAGYDAASLCLLPTMRIRQEHTAQWIADREWMVEPFVEFRDSVSQTGDARLRIIAAMNGMGPAMEAVFRRVESRGWVLKPDEREVARIGDETA